MKKGYTITLFALLAIWQLAAVTLHNDILIPYPIEVIKQFLTLFTKPAFYTATGLTILRILKGFFISLLIAFLCSILSGNFPFFHDCFQPIQVILKSIPNVSYMIMALIWLGAEGAVSTVTFMILFPIFFGNFMTLFDSENVRQKDAERLYQETFLQKLKTKTIPQMIPVILSTGKTAVSLGFKVGVMAEILGQIRYGVGKQLYLSKLNLDTTALLAWTLVIILISIGFDKLFDQFIFYHNKEEQE